MDTRTFWELSESYQRGVYAPETLTEEELISIQEWAEELIKEGYNLSLYSDDELYEAYLKEMSNIVRTGTSTNAAGKKINWKHTHNPSTNISTVKDKFRTRNLKDKSRFKEELDLFDVVLDHLISEGFCDTVEGASVVMANMSDEWRDEIVKGINEQKK